MTVKDGSMREALPFLLIGLGGGLAVIVVRTIGWHSEGAGICAMLLGAALTLGAVGFVPRKLEDWYKSLSERALQRLAAMLAIAFVVLLGMIGTHY